MKQNVGKILFISVVSGIVFVMCHFSVSTRYSANGVPWYSHGIAFVLGMVLGVTFLSLGIGFRRRQIQEKDEELRRLAEHIQKQQKKIDALIEEKEKHREDQRHAPKLEALGRLAGGISHDVNNVLASIMSIASTMKLDMEMTNCQVPAEDVNDILDACRRGRDLTLSLLGFARKGDFLKRPISLVKEIEDIRKLLLRVSPKSLGIKLDFESDIPQIEGDPSEIKNVLMNLCINGIDAMSGDGELTVALRKKKLKKPTEFLPAGPYVLLQVTDTGEGMSEETLRRAFEPFYTTKPEGKGTGLGLPRVWAIVQAHSGSVEIDSDSGIGTTFNVMFPALDEAREDPGIRGSRPPVKDLRRHTVLLVDDEVLIRKSAKRIFEKIGYAVYVAEDGQRAIQILSEHRHEIDLIVLDMIMPIMDGPATFARAREMRPDIPVILCSGYSKDDSATELLKNDNVGFVQKPFSVGEISSRMSQILGFDA
ncbi:MAG: response regulator [Deltaproteobacteria bacterium]|nr:response regulator [Deltaproteobacteria bacterium]